MAIHQTQPAVQQRRLSATITTVPPPNAHSRGVNLNINRHPAYIQRIAQPNRVEPAQLTNSVSAAQGVAHYASKSGPWTVGTAQLTRSAKTGLGAKMASLRTGAVVQCNPLITVNGKVIDAGKWTLREIQEWLHAGPAGQYRADREEMLRHLAERTAADMTEKQQQWADEDPVYRFSTADPNAVESLYFESTLNPGKYGRLRSQHKHGPVATKFQYAQQLFGTYEEATLVSRAYHLNKAQTLGQLTRKALDIGMTLTRVDDAAGHIEIFTRAPIDNQDQPIKSIHRSGGKILERPDPIPPHTWFQFQHATFFDLSTKDADRLESTFDLLYKR
jgi:hypothetical protein